MTSNARSDESMTVMSSSGNVFADLGLPDPELRLAKASLAAAIAQAIESNALTQKEAGELTGLDQPRISAITRGHLGGFTIDRLFRTLIALGQDVEIIVHGSAEARAARLTVNVESVSA